MESVLWPWPRSVRPPKDWKPGGHRGPAAHALCDRVSTLKLVDLLQHDFQFWGGFLHVRGEYRQEEPEVISKTTTGMRRMNEQRKDNCVLLLGRRCRPAAAHVLVRVYALHGCSHGIADKVHFPPLGAPGRLPGAWDWRRVHGLRDVFFPKNTCVVKGHYLLSNYTHKPGCPEEIIHKNSFWKTVQL